MVIKSPATCDEFRDLKWCEWCGCLLRYASECAHVFSRGTGQLDIRRNLIGLGGPWDCACHHNSHWGKSPTNEELLEKVAEREQTTPDAIRALIYWLRRAPKGTEYTDPPTPAGRDDQRPADGGSAGSILGIQR